MQQCNFSNNFGNVNEYTEGTFSHFIPLTVLLLLQAGDTPLIGAARGGHTDTVKQLLSSRATIDLANHVSAWKSVTLSFSIIYSPHVVWEPHQR